VLPVSRRRKFTLRYGDAASRSWQSHRLIADQTHRLASPRGLSREAPDPHSVSAPKGMASAWVSAGLSGRLLGGQGSY
jgi:hypothetical protein